MLNAGEEMKRYLSSIEVLLALYNDVDKYELFDYWTTAGGKEKSVAAQVYRNSLQAYRRDAKLADKVPLRATLCARAFFFNPHFHAQAFGLVARQVAKFISETGDPKGAIPLVVDALAILEKHYGPSKEVADVLHDLALLYEQTAEMDQVIQFCCLRISYLASCRPWLW